MQRTPTTGRRWWWAALGLALGYVALTGTIVVTMVRGTDPIPVAGPGLALATLAAAAFSLRAASHRHLHRRSRTAWRWIAASCLTLLLSVVLFSTQTGRPASGLMLGDFARLAFIPLVVTGLLKLPRQVSSRIRTYQLILDAGVVAAAGFIPLWYLQIGPSAQASVFGLARLLVAAAYPLGDLALLFSIAVVLMRGVDRSARQPLRLLVAASGPWIVSDVWASYSGSTSGTGQPGGWLFLCWITAHTLLAAAGLTQCRWAHTDLNDRPEQRLNPASRLPYLAVLFAFTALLLVVVREDAGYPWGGLVLGSAALVGLVVLRQMLGMRQTHLMAVTDSLTGLANRAFLLDSLTHILARATHSAETIAVLMTDLDGFKIVNDTYGHQAGDELLVGYAAMLRRAVLGSDVVARLGGDEFAVVLHRVQRIEDAETVARRIMSEMTEPVLAGGRLLQVRGSIGIAMSGPGELTVDELMHRADLAMYEAKRHHGGGLRRYDQVPLDAPAGAAKRP